MPFCDGITGKSVLKGDLLKAMEETKNDKPDVSVEVTDRGPLRICGNFILKDLREIMKLFREKYGCAGAANHPTSPSVTGHTGNEIIKLSKLS